jgi:hypothetical protein
MALNLTPDEIDELDRQLRHRRVAEQVPQGPVPPAPGTWEHAVAVEQERKRQERIAAANAEEERLRIEREAEERRRADEWERNAPKRERARAELAKVEPRLERLDRDRRELVARRRELELEASR